MSDRYTVSENPFGYESDVGTARLRYALTDNRPTHASVYWARDRQHILVPNKFPQKVVPFRHLCYGPHKEDLQALADAMNAATGDPRATVANYVRARKEAEHGL